MHSVSTASPSGDNLASPDSTHAADGQSWKRTFAKFEVSQSWKRPYSSRGLLRDCANFLDLRFQLYMARPGPPLGERREESVSWMLTEGISISNEEILTLTSTRLRWDVQLGSLRIAL